VVVCAPGARAAFCRVLGLPSATTTKKIP